MECWNQLLDHIYGMARDIPWLREECGMVLVEAVKSLKAQPQFVQCAEEAIKRLTPFKLVSTPQGVAVWLTVRASYEKVLPDGVWHQKDPLSRKERPRLAKLLKEDFHVDSEDAKDKAIKSAAANPNPTFAWDLVFGEILRRDEDSKGSAKEPPKAEFPQLWIDVVDSTFTTHDVRLQTNMIRQPVLHYLVSRAQIMGLQTLQQHDHTGTYVGCTCAVQSQSDEDNHQPEQEGR